MRLEKGGAREPVQAVAALQRRLENNPEILKGENPEILRGKNPKILKPV